jgi:DNA-binding MarR family transcriptional regulator
LPNTAFTQTWEQTDSLLALRELIEVGGQVAPAVARRAALTHHELQALESVIDRAVGPVEIARELGVTSAAASGIVDRLAARGHVVREPHVSDRRRIQVVITESGREEVLGYLMPMFASLADLDRSLTDDERALIARYLRGAIDAMRALL